MSPTRSAGFAHQMHQARAAYFKADWQTAFYYLENAHVLGQPSTRRHTLSHWWMLKVAIKRHDLSEVLGQTMRILASLLFSRLWVPVGNTGGANVSAVKPMPIRPELNQYLE